MDLYIARHGETLSAVNNIILGNGGDSPLTQKGIEEAKALGKTFENMTFDAVYTSPLGRAVNTIGIAFADRYSPVVDNRLTGIGLGVIEGLSWDAAFASFPDAGTFMSDPVSYIPPPQGEHLTDMIERVSAFLDDIARMDYTKVFVLTHGYVLRVLYACTVDKSILSIGKAREYANCEVAHYRYESGKWTLL